MYLNENIIQKFKLDLSEPLIQPVIRCINKPA